MEGYDERTYGQRWADVYDEWYGDLGDADFARRLATVLGDRRPARVCELGVGTGRLMEMFVAERGGPGDELFGVDSSEAMLAVLASKRAGLGCTVTLGDMSRVLPEGPFDLVYAGYNTILNLRDRPCLVGALRLVARSLSPEGDFLLDAAVMDEESPERVSIRSMTADSIVLSATRLNPAAGTIEGQFVELADGRAPRLRPWVVRNWTPADVDDAAVEAGLALVERHRDGDGGAHGPDSSRHVSRYRRR